jgi:uncharacterized membrane protein
MWFEIIGNFLAFFGSILFSSGLLQTKEQIKDENATCLNENPYTNKSKMSSRHKNILAFFFIVTGFAISLSSRIGELFPIDTCGTILLCVVIAFLGYFVIFCIYYFNKYQYECFKRKLKRERFYKSIYNLTTRYKRYNW